MDDATKRYDSEIAVHSIIWGIVILAVVVVVSMLLMSVMLDGYQRRALVLDPAPPAMVEARVAPHPSGPRLQDSPPVDLRMMRSQERFFLENYGWVDRPAGLARIPVSKAMEILAASALPVREEPAAPAPAATPESSPAATPAAPVEPATP